MVRIRLRLSACVSVATMKWNDVYWRQNQAQNQWPCHTRLGQCIRAYEVKHTSTHDYTESTKSTMTLYVYIWDERCVCASVRVCLCVCGGVIRPLYFPQIANENIKPHLVAFIEIAMPFDKSLFAFHSLNIIYWRSTRVPHALVCTFESDLSFHG